MLRAVTSAFDAIGADLWRYDAADVLGLVLVATEGGPVAGLGNGAHQGLTAEARAKSHALPVLQRRRIQMDHEEDFNANPQYVPLRPYLQAWRVRTVVSVPMFFGDSHVGTISLRFASRLPFSPEDGQFALDLARKEGLSIHLAKVARQLDVARGQLDAMACANRAMHRNLSTLTDSAGLDGLLGQVLRTIVEHMGEEAGALWLSNPETGESYNQLSMDDGVVRPAQATENPAAGRTSQTLFAGSSQYRMKSRGTVAVLRCRSRTAAEGSTSARSPTAGSACSGCRSGPSGSARC